MKNKEILGEMIGIKDLLDMLDTTNTSVSVLSKICKNIIEIQISQQEQINSLLETLEK